MVSLVISVELKLKTEGILLFHISHNPNNHIFAIDYLQRLLLDIHLSELISSTKDYEIGKDSKMYFIIATNHQPSLYHINLPSFYHTFTLSFLYHTTTLSFVHHANPVMKLSLYLSVTRLSQPFASVKRVIAH